MRKRKNSHRQWDKKNKGSETRRMASHPINKVNKKEEEMITIKV